VAQTEPEALSFLVTAAFNLEPDLKYQLLETRSTVERLERLKEILVSTVAKWRKARRFTKLPEQTDTRRKRLIFKVTDCSMPV
jgi:hypothetical protein